jgi:NADH-quinone oxidoreductase subunit N
MNLSELAFALSPELALLVGACIVLMVGVSGGANDRLAVPTAFAVTLVALTLAVFANPDQIGMVAEREILPGLWLNSFSHFARLITLAFGAVAILVSWNQPVARERGEYMAMILFSLLGVLLTAAANDWVVLFFAIELVSIPTYVMIALSRTDARASESAVKYFFLGALSAAILAYGLSFLYGATGTTTITLFLVSETETSMRFASGIPTTAIIGIVLVFAGLAFKIAAVPFHAYVADVYEGAASPVTGFLGFVPKFAGFLALIKVLMAIGWQLPTSLFWMFWIVAAATITTGNVLGLLQRNVKRTLAYSSIAHSGYLLVALLVGPLAYNAGYMPRGTDAILFYIAIYGFMNLGAFAALTALRTDGRDAETLEDISGAARRAPGVCLGLAICIFSLMGFPPTAGFLGKLYILGGAFSLGQGEATYGPMVALAIIAVVNSAIAAAYYLRILAAAYFGEPTTKLSPESSHAPRWALAVCAIPMLLIFVRPAGMTRFCKNSAGIVYSIALDARKTLTTSSDKPKSPNNSFVLAADHADPVDP